MTTETITIACCFGPVSTMTTETITIACCFGPVEISYYGDGEGVLSGAWMRGKSNGCFFAEQRAAIGIRVDEIKMSASDFEGLRADMHRASGKTLTELAELSLREALLRSGDGVMSCGHHRSHLPINGTECSACRVVGPSSAASEISPTHGAPAEAKGLAAWLPDKPIEYGLDRTPARVAEQGKGIAAMSSGPDNSVTHLAEDLLCDDE